jgi:hypothetical protein
VRQRDRTVERVFWVLHGENWRAKIGGRKLAGENWRAKIGRQYAKKNMCLTPRHVSCYHSP